MLDNQQDITTQFKLLGSETVFTVSRPLDTNDT